MPSRRTSFEADHQGMPSLGLQIIADLYIYIIYNLSWMFGSVWMCDGSVLCQLRLGVQIYAFSILPCA